MFSDVLICLRFFSRIPVPTTEREIALGVGGLSAAAAMVPVAGLVIGLFPAAILLAAAQVGLAPMVAAALALSAAVLITGAIHEDALADCADGFGGGSTRERKLEIMRDSRIGAFGGCAIGLSLLLRTSALAAIYARNPWLATSVMLTTASFSRTACLFPLLLLRPARSDGRGAAAPLSRRKFLTALAVAVVLASIPLMTGAGIQYIVVALLAALGSAFAMVVLASRMIGGQTGDVAGGAQQLAEIAMLVVLSASP